MVVMWNLREWGVFLIVSTIWLRTIFLLKITWYLDRVWELLGFQVPIIKLEMEAPFDELEVDINCNNVPGIYNSHLLHYYSRSFCFSRHYFHFIVPAANFWCVCLVKIFKMFRIDDRFPALCLLVKHWAINARINDAMNGTFNRCHYDY